MQYYIDIDIASIPYFLFLYLLACLLVFVCLFVLLGGVCVSGNGTFPQKLFNILALFCSLVTVCWYWHTTPRTFITINKQATDAMTT